MRPLRQITLPFAHVNLRRNPFGEVSQNDRSRLSVIDVDAARLQAPGCALLFLGEAGRGKTSHLLGTRTHFPDAPYVHLTEGEPVPPIPTAPLVFVDELQRMPRRMRRRLFRRPNASFVIGSHLDHSAEMRAAGLNVKTVTVASRSPEQLAKIIQTRIEWARRNAGPVPTVGPAAIARLIDRFGDNVRAMEHHLYTIFQHLEEAGDVKV